MAKTLDFNVIVPPTLPLVMRDPERTKIDVVAPTEGLGEELEAMAAKVEDPQMGITDIGKYMKRSQELIEACRVYLRGARQKLEQ